MVSTPAHVEVFLLCTCRRGSSATTGRPTWEFRPTLLLGPGRRRCGTGCERLRRGRHDLSGAQSAMDRLLRTYFRSGCGPGRPAQVTAPAPGGRDPTTRRRRQSRIASPGFSPKNLDQQYPRVGESSREPHHDSTEEPIEPSTRSDRQAHPTAEEAKGRQEEE